MVIVVCDFIKVKDDNLSWMDNLAHVLVGK